MISREMVRSQNELTSINGTGEWKVNKAFIWLEHVRRMSFMA